MHGALDQKVLNPKRLLKIGLILIFLAISGLSCGRLNFLKPAGKVKIEGFEQVISSNTEWKKSKSPFYIQHNLFIADKATLTIEPGVKIYLSPGIVVMCHGRIVADGKKESPIYFKGVSENPWARIECFGGGYEKPGELAVNVFHYCIVEGGGGITIRSAGADIQGCTFRNNKSSPLRLDSSSGRIIENEIFENVTQRESESGNGAGIMVYTNKMVLIADNVIHDNFSSGGKDGGGGIYACSYDSGQISILRNTIYGNLSDHNGGGIFAYSCHIEENQVRYNSTSDSGGGIYAVQSSLVNNRIRQNQALRGGGVYADNSRMEYNLVLENTARSGFGGGLFFSGDNEIINNTFIKNGARDIKGDTIVVSGNPKITGNNIISEYGYALRTQNYEMSPDLDATGNYWGTADENTISELIYDWLDDSQISLVEFKEFSENWIARAPDEPYTWSAPQPPIERPPNQLYGRIERNRILGRFGRLSFDVVENVLIPDGITLHILPGTHLSCSPKVNIRVRGALVLEGDKENPVLMTGDSESPWGNLIFENKNMFTASATGKAVSEALEADEKSALSYCIVENGAGIIMEGTGVKIEDSVIRQNYGSGIKIQEAAATVSRTDIVDNISPINGGGVCIYGSKPVTIDNNQIRNNYAENNGGGIYVSGENADAVSNISNNRIENNQARKDGGGIWAARSSILNNQICSNSSEGKGGGLFSTFNIVEENHFGGNKAVEGGGIFSEVSSSFYQNTIEKNSITGPCGGGVYLNFQEAASDNAVFSKNRVTENSAEGDPPVGGIYLKGFVEIEESNLFHNQGVQLYNANTADVKPIRAINCYWGTDKPDEIDKMIFANRDDSALSSVIYTPFSNVLINIGLPKN